MERRSPTPGATRKREAVQRLKTGLEEDRFVLHYQPIVGVLDGRVVALEALLRWRDRESGDVDDLIWSAERSPIIGKLENWTLRHACDGVKIPRVFVEKALTEKRSKTIVARVVELAHDLELRVVAEGVETQAQRDLIAALGCDLFQGYLFHAPMAALDLACALRPPGPVSDTLPA